MVVYNAVTSGLTKPVLLRILNMSGLTAREGREPTWRFSLEENRTALRRLPGNDAGERAKEPREKTRLDRDMVEDASSRHEQFVDERERWLNDPE